MYPLLFTVDNRSDVKPMAADRSPRPILSNAASDEALQPTFVMVEI